MNRKQWRDQVIESALEPDLPIVDAHHHVWAIEPAPPFLPYDAELFLADKSGEDHNVIATVYVDSRSAYRSEGPKALRVIGETEFANQIAETAEQRGGRSAGACAGIVAHADLTLGVAVGEVLDAHIAASRRFCGIRHITAFEPGLPPTFGAMEMDIMMQPIFREGFAELVQRDLSFDAWLLQPQLPELIDLAQAFPEASIVVDHVGGPIAIRRYAGRQAEAFANWKRDMTELARFPRVVVKLGGMNMHSTGLDATEKERPPSSEQAAALHRDHILTAIDLFGPERCMFESNFPVDMNAISYVVLWNSFKRISEGFTPAERAQLFSATAQRVYRLKDDAQAA